MAKADGTTSITSARKRLGAQVLRLIPMQSKRSQVDQGTVEVLEEMLERARRGEITGLIFGIYEHGRNGCVGTTGEYRRNLLNTLGVATRIQVCINKAIDNGGLKELP